MRRRRKALVRISIVGVALLAGLALPAAASASLTINTISPDLNITSVATQPDTDATVSYGSLYAGLAGNEFRIVNNTTESNPAFRNSGDTTDCKDTNDDASIPENTVFCDDTEAAGGGAVTNIDYDGTSVADKLTIDASVPASVTSDFAGSTNDDVFQGGGGVDTAVGAGGEDDLSGGGNTDDLWGGAGAEVDSLHGEGGDDTLETGDDGADVLDGGPQGAGGDTAKYSHATAGVTAGLDGVSNDGVTGENDTLTAIENLTGGNFNDALSGDGGANAINGGLSTGDDTISGGSATNTGPDGNDTLTGGSSTIAGDTVSYANRDDEVTVGLSQIVNNGGASGGATPDLDDVSGFESATGGDGDDDLTGANGTSTPNALNGGAGDDSLFGGTSAGNDGADAFSGGSSGTPGGAHSTIGDTVDYNARNDAIAASLATGSGPNGDSYNGIENLVGGDGADNLAGDANANRLTGHAAGDTITGNGGSDTAFGEGGPDALVMNDSVADALINCGTEVDSATFDLGLETPNANCETQTGIVPPPPPPAGGSTAPSSPAAAATPAITTATATKCKKKRRRAAAAKKCKKKR